VKVTGDKIVFRLKSAKLNFSVVSVMHIKWDTATTTTWLPWACEVARKAWAFYC